MIVIIHNGNDSREIHVGVVKVDATTNGGLNIYFRTGNMITIKDTKKYIGYEVVIGN